LTAATTTPLPIARLILTVRADAPLHLPPYIGSTLRGAFGHALKSLALLPHHHNNPCALAERCPYCQVFAPAPQPTHPSGQTPAPYIIEPPAPYHPRRLQPGQTFRFGLVLIGKALPHLPAIVQAFERAMRHGLTQQHTPCTLLNVQHEQARQTLWQTGQSQATQPATTIPPASTLGQHLSLHLHTPLRLQQQSRIIGQNQLTAYHLLIGLARRYQLLLDTHLGPQAPQQNFSQLAELAHTIDLDASELHWFDWERYSNRQQQAMKLGGLLGTLHLHGQLAPFSQLLHLGQWLHLGKETTFGLGGYAIDQDTPATRPAHTHTPTATA
jgi:hypothetical protein